MLTHKIEKTPATGESIKSSKELESGIFSTEFLHAIFSHDKT